MANITYYHHIDFTTMGVGTSVYEDCGDGTAVCTVESCNIISMK